MVSSIVVQKNFKRDESRAKSPSKSSMALTMRSLRRLLPSLFRRKVLATRSWVLTAVTGLVGNEVDEMCLAAFLEVESLTLKLSSRGDLITSGEQ